MSVKKSWDIQPRAKKPSETAKPTASRSPAARRSMGDMRRKQPATKVSTVRSATPVSKRNVTIARGKKARPEPKEPLKKRRKKTRKAFLIVIGIALLLLVAGLFYVAWLPALRVNAVTANGPRAEEAGKLAQQELWGTHAYILPRNSLFFIPTDDVRARLLAAYPDIEAVSIAPEGLNTLRVTLLPRAEAFIWCGTERAFPEEYCYSANAEGLIFAPLDTPSASSTDALRVYAPVQGREGASPVRAHIGYASRIPEALRFVKAMQTLGAGVVSLSFRDDEADLHTRAGTRITYVLGREQEAAGIAASVFPQLQLNDGSISYVDLRFSGKAYFKRATEELVGEDAAVSLEEEIGGGAEEVVEE